MAGVLQALSESAHPVPVRVRQLAVEEPDHRYGRLLPPRNDRPRCRAAEPSDKRAPFHSMTSSARVRSEAGVSMPISFAVFRLTTVINFVGCSAGRSRGFAPFRILSTKLAAWRHISGKSTP